MQMKKITFYAIRIILVLGKQEIKTVPQLGKTLNLKASYIRIIMRQLKAEGLVCSTSGNGGGFRLYKEANAITLWDIVRIMEGTTECCLGEKQYAYRTDRQNRFVEKIYCDIQKDIEEEFSKNSIQRLLS